MDANTYQTHLHSITSAFAKLHTKWLTAKHRRDMNEEMDNLAITLGLNPLTLENKDQ